MTALHQPEPSHELRHLLQVLFRRFGVLATGATPCGQPLQLAHAHALMVLLQEGELSQQALGRVLGIDKSNVARLCARMAGVGHIQQRTSDQDLRSRRVALTEKGMRLAQEVQAASQARFAAVLAEIPIESQATVLTALGQLVAAMDRVPAVPPSPRRSS
ncbi:MAG: MarR family transcriptional regulator [Deltaproteobacteria bacterium]|nr:MarR family transcriptional regulator [Deltaproteobacteria bacterium]